MALTLLSMTIGLGLAGAQTARHAAQTAREARQAGSLMQSILETAPPQLGEQQGRQGALAWRYAEAQLADQGPASPLRLCRRSVDAVSAQGGRHYSLQTLVPCPVDQAR
ncbi:MAG TPA: hypothetical protein VF459_16595 [Caulobacteraceae bacterium]